MGFFDDYDDERPRRKTRRGIGVSARLDWQDMVEEIDEPDEEPEDDTIQELEIDEHGRIRHSSGDEAPNLWDQDE
jgi:CBS domain containing-hemolysin-like protein